MFFLNYHFVVYAYIEIKLVCKILIVDKMKSIKTSSDQKTMLSYADILLIAVVMLIMYALICQNYHS